MSSQIDLIYREWQEAIRDRFNIKGEQVVVAKPSNPAHLSILKEMCLKAGFTSDEANSIVLILEKFQAKNVDSGKVVDFDSKEARDNAIKSGSHEELEASDKDDGKEVKPETNPNFTQTDKERTDPSQSTSDGSHLTNNDTDKQKEEKKAPILEHIDDDGSSIYLTTNQI